MSYVFGFHCVVVEEREATSGERWETASAERIRETARVVLSSKKMLFFVRKCSTGLFAKKKEPK